MKSVFTLSFLVTLFLTASTALAYDCYEQAPPPQVVVQVQQPCGCSLCKTKQYQKPQCKCKQRQSCSTCSQCNKYKTCNTYSCSIRKPSRSKKAVCQQKYQCQTTYTKKTERVATTQCKLCGNYYSKGVKHYCKKKQCQTGKKYTKVRTNSCNKNKVQRTICNTQYRQEVPVPYDCGEVRYKSCEVRYSPTRTRVPQYEGGSRQVATYCNLNVNRQENRETMETRWNAWVSRNQY